MSAAGDRGVVARFHDVDVDGIRFLLCDADGNLFPSEEPAFVASTVVVNRLMASLGSFERFEPEQLRLATTGKNFRTTAADLAAACGKSLDAADFEHWIAEEKRQVTEHLRRTLTPDPDVVDALTRLSERFELAAVSSSALSRLDASFSVTGVSDLLPEAVRFSAEDSLAEPTSKPDPAIYAFAAERLGIQAHEAVAIEDSLPGAQSAIAAGFATVGNVRYVAIEEREARIAELTAAGAYAVIDSWGGLEQLLSGAAQARALST